jgi:nitroreductase
MASVDAAPAVPATGFARLVASRTSVRRFDRSRPVTGAVLRAVLEAARHAPSADNAQPWRFVVVDDPVLRERLVEKCFAGLYARTRRIQAPAYIALCGVRGAVDRGGRLLTSVSYTLMDCGIAGEHAVLAATELGLGTCWIGWFNRRQARALLGVPAGVDVLALIAIGWPAAGPIHPVARPHGRKSLAAIAWRNRWDGAPVE